MRTADSARVSRREFLYYIWAASMAVLTAESAGGILWILSASRDFPRRDMVLHLKPDSVPEVGAPPFQGDDNKHVWYSNTPQGLLAFHNYCTHLGCGIHWSIWNNRFECPCHGAKFKADGTWIEGPAFRNLDSFKVTVTTPHGEKTTPASGGPVDITDATAITIDLDVYLLGKRAR